MRIAEFKTIEGAEVHIDLESIELIMYSDIGATIRTKTGEDIDLELDQAKMLEYAWVRHLDAPRSPIGS